jgi:hypothetical protein
MLHQRFEAPPQLFCIPAEESDSDGAYYQVAKGRKGWYVTVWVDGAWTGDIATDKGPWKTEQEALDWGRGEAQEWCLKNGISYE